jgi:hypothetical protein
MRDGGLVDMSCLHSRLSLAAGDRVRVTLDAPADVMLLDDPNFDLREAGEPYEYSGGRAMKSPVEIAAPATGTWNVVIDVGETGVPAAASVQVLK